MANGAPPIVVQKKKGGMGCFGCGCAILIAIIVAILALFALSGATFYHKAEDMTTPAAIPLPQTDAGESVYDAAHQKVSNFEDAFDRQQPATLRLNSDEINTLIARDPAYSALRGHLTVTLAGDQATLQSSMQLGLAEKAFFPDRFLNSTATVSVSFDPTQQMPLFVLHRIQVKDQDQDLDSNGGMRQLVNQMINQSFAQQMQNNQAAHDFLAHVQNISIENGQLVIQTK